MSYRYREHNLKRSLNTGYECHGLVAILRIAYIVDNPDEHGELIITLKNDQQSLAFQILAFSAREQMILIKAGRFTESGSLAPSSHLHLHRCSSIIVSIKSGPRSRQQSYSNITKHLPSTTTSTISNALNTPKRQFSRRWKLV